MIISLNILKWIIQKLENKQKQSINFIFRLECDKVIIGAMMAKNKSPQSDCFRVEGPNYNQIQHFGGNKDD
jgi:hypothetical protein